MDYVALPLTHGLALLLFTLQVLKGDKPAVEQGTCVAAQLFLSLSFSFYLSRPPFPFLAFAGDGILPRSLVLSLL